MGLKLYLHFRALVIAQRRLLGYYLLISFIVCAHVCAEELR